MNSSSVKLYSLTTIGAGTFLGGPLAGGLMARRNLLNLGRNRSALTPIYLSLAMTIAVFLVVAMAPSGLTEKLPGSFMPAIYIAILVGWCRNAMGSEIEQHKVDDGPFYSGWKAFGVSLLSLVITLVLGFGIIFFGPQSSVDAAYQKGWERVVANETKAQELATLASKQGVTEQELVDFLDQTFLPAWEDSDKAVTEMESLKWLDQSTTDQRTALRGYVNLQKERGKLLRQVLTTGDEAASKALDQVQADIEKVDLTAK